MEPVPAARIGFVGFGEVASTFAEPLVQQGALVLAYDVLLERGGGSEILQKRLLAEGVQFRSLRETVLGVDYILSTVTTQVARQAAQECVPYLKPGQVYIDLNSTAPSVKVEMAKQIAPSGADFVEGAILGAVGATGAKTHILVGGEKGPIVAATLVRLGLNVTHYSVEIGQASRFKMLRSIFSKGLEALVLEFLITGKRAGIERDLWDEVVQLMREHPFEQTCANWIKTHAIAHERRYHEMAQVTETMREIGIEPVLTAGTLAFFRRSLALGMGDRFVEKPDSVNAVIDFMEQRLRADTG